MEFMVPDEPEPKRVKEYQESPFGGSGPAVFGASTTSKGSEFSIQNVIATADFGRPIDLKALEKHYVSDYKGTSKYEPKFADRFQALFLKRSAPEKITGVLFPSGKILCIGARSETIARTAITSMLNVVRQVVYPGKAAGSMAQPEAAKIHNIVASFETGFDIQLEHLALEHPGDVTYEPEVFKSLIFAVKVQQKLIAFVSAKGKVIISGAKFESDLGDAQKYLLPILTRFKRNGPNYHLKG